MIKVLWYLTRFNTYTWFCTFDCLWVFQLYIEEERQSDWYLPLGHIYVQVRSGNQIPKPLPTTSPQQWTPNTLDTTMSRPNPYQNTLNSTSGENPGFPAWYLRRLDSYQLNLTKLPLLFHRQKKNPDMTMNKRRRPSPDEPPTTHHPPIDLNEALPGISRRITACAACRKQKVSLCPFSDRRLTWLMNGWEDRSDAICQRAYRLVRGVGDGLCRVFWIRVYSHWSMRQSEFGFEFECSCIRLVWGVGWLW